MGTVTNPKDERKYQVGKLENWIGDNGVSCHVIGISNGWQNQKYGRSKIVIVGYGRNLSVTISGELEILPENTEKSVKSRKWN